MGQYRFIIILEFVSRKLLALLFLLVIFSQVADATEIEELYKKANELYQQEEYSKAINTYRQIIGKDFESWEVYYNLGNSYFRYGDIGHAILNYERAKRLAPQNEDILHNLKIANLSIVDKVEDPPKFFVIKVLDDFLAFTGLKMNLDQLTRVMLIVYLIFMALVLIRLIALKKLTRRRIFYAILPIFVVLAILFTAFQVQVYSMSDYNEAIIVVDKVDVMSSPDEGATQVFTLHQGVKVKVEKFLKKDTEGWIEIKLADGKNGWVLDAVVERI